MSVFISLILNKTTIQGFFLALILNFKVNILNTTHKILNLSKNMVFLIDINFLFFNTFSLILVINFSLNFKNYHFLIDAFRTDHKIHIFSNLILNIPGKHFHFYIQLIPYNLSIIL